MKSALLKPSHAGFAITIFFSFLFSLPELIAQTPVLQYQANYVSSSPASSYNAFPTSPGTFSSCSGNLYTYTWNNGIDNQLKLASFSANSKTYVVAAVSGVVVKLRRVNNATVTGIRNILYSESLTSPATSCVTPRTLNFMAPYNDDMSSFLNNNILNHGTDNIFTNASNGDGNNNNIERVDVVFTTGISTSLPADAGFILCDRGNNNSHDGFRIAAILSIDGSNNPTSFGVVRTCVAGNGSNNGSWGHPSIANGNKQIAAYILRKDAADTYLRVSSNVNQEIGGVFFSLSDLAVAPGQIIYGYSLLSPDGTANPTSAQLLNLNDAAVYPTGTTEAQGGGLDLISINTFFGTDQALAGTFFSNFHGAVKNENAILDWKIDNLPEGSLVTLQRSINTISFSPVFSYKQEGSHIKSYQDLPGTGIFFYRLKIETTVGSVFFSRIIQLSVNTQKQVWKSFPTIIKTGNPVYIENIPSGSYTALLRNNSSATVLKTTFKANNGKGILSFPDNQLSNGVYYLSFEKDGIQIPGIERIIYKN